MLIRAATDADAPALAALYGHHVLHGLASFEETPPDAAEMARRRAHVAGYGLPYLVAEDEGRVLGFAYASPFRLRPAYRYTCEDSVYVAHDAAGRGVGRALLAAVLEACTDLGLRQVVAVIGDSANAASIGLHRALGFEPMGIGRGFGWKHGQWVDSVWMQKPLNGGDSAPPEGPGLSLALG